MLLTAFTFSQTVTAPLSLADLFMSAEQHEQHKEQTLKLCGRSEDATFLWGLFIFPQLLMLCWTQRVRLTEWVEIQKTDQVLAAVQFQVIPS